jgi:hypothetical protein
VLFQEGGLDHRLAFVARNGYQHGPNKCSFFSLLFLFALATTVKADIAPPLIAVNLTYAGGAINGTFYAAALSCMNNTGVNASGVTVPQLTNVSQYDASRGCYWRYNSSARAWCADSLCSFEFFPNSDFKMAFYLPSLNKTFITNAINVSNFTRDYGAQLYPNGSATIVGISKPGPAPVDLLGFFLALIFTLAIELPVAFLYLRAIKIKKKERILAAVAIANIISVPALWFGFVSFLGTPGLLLGEVFAVVFEGYFVYYFNKKAIALKSAMIMSLFMNLASLIIGGLILLSLTGWI